MGLFGIGKKNKEKVVKPVKEPKVEKKVKETSVVSTTKKEPSRGSGFSSVLLGTRVTEKASLLSENNNVYTFNISSEANKNTISCAIKDLYNVTPVKVRIVSVPSKAVIVRGKKGTKRGGRKAYVYLKEGEKIEIN